MATHTDERHQPCAIAKGELDMTPLSTRISIATFVLSLVLAGFSGCQRKTPAEKAGDKIEDVGDKVEDKLD